MKTNNLIAVGGGIALLFFLTRKKNSTTPPPAPNTGEQASQSQEPAQNDVVAQPSQSTYATPTNSQPDSSYAGGSSAGQQQTAINPVTIIDQVITQTQPQTNTSAATPEVTPPQIFVDQEITNPAVIIDRIIKPGANIATALPDSYARLGEVTLHQVHGSIKATHKLRTSNSTLWLNPQLYWRNGIRKSN